MIFLRRNDASRNVVLLQNMFKCDTCVGKPFRTLSLFAKHVALEHAFERNFQMECGFTHCKQKFKRFSSLRSHIYRHHKIHRFRRTNNLNEIPSCPECSFPVAALNDVYQHLKMHMTANSNILCPFNNCEKSYRVWSSLTSHVSRYHSCENLGALKSIWYPANQRKEIVCPEANFECSGQNCIYEDVADDSGTVYIKSYASLILKLQEKYSLPESTVQSILDDFSTYFELTNNYTQIKVTSVLSENGVQPELVHEIETTLGNNVFQMARKELNSKCKQFNFFCNNFSVVKPVTYNLGRNNNGSDCSFEYVPLLDTLRLLLRDKEVQEMVYENTSTRTQVMEDFKDGAYFINHPLNSSEQPWLQIILYFDEFEVVNPLGGHKKKHKIAAFYYTLGNIHYKFR